MASTIGPNRSLDSHPSPFDAIGASAIEDRWVVTNKLDGTENRAA
jgi:hypothetical protein